jgi:hypothetical protein
VQFELTRYLSDNWAPVIETDVDGPNSLPLRTDGLVTNLGKFAACRRVARTIYLGSAPLTHAAHRGIEDRRVKLGCVMPGETTAIFGDALRRLATSATYLYQEGARYWYSTQPTVTKLADDRAEQLKRDPDKVAHEIERRLRADVGKRGDFGRVHPLPPSSQEVPDDLDARLVVLGIDHAYVKEPGNPAEVAAKAILDFRGTTPRLYQNTLVFLAADKNRLQDLDEAARKYLAWESIVEDEEALNLDPQQTKQAERQKASSDGAVNARIPETYQWLLVPSQGSPQEPIELKAHKLSGQEGLAARASKKLRSDESFLASYAGTRLRMDLDKIPLWRGNHVSVRQLVEDFARYPYLSRLSNPTVLVDAIRDGLALLTWQQDSFAFADSFDEDTARYRGLRAGQAGVPITADSQGLIIKGDIARAQLDAASVPPPPSPRTGAHSQGSPGAAGADPATPAAVVPAQPRRFHGTVALDSTRIGRDAGRVAEEVVAHLAGLVGAKVTVTLEIQAEVPSGAPEHVVRTVTENSRTLKFTSHGFETE